MAQRNSAPASALVEREVVITRVFDAPRKLVYEAWTDARHVAQWWGPKVFTNPVCEVDARVGGRWRIVMRAPDGVEYPGEGVYTEIVPEARLVFTNTAKDKDGNLMLEGLTTITFEDFEGKTKLTLVTRMRGLMEGTERMLAGMEAGWSQSLEKLEALVAGGRISDARV